MYKEFDLGVQFFQVINNGVFKLYYLNFPRESKKVIQLLPINAIVPEKKEGKVKGCDKC